jgi:hypothetical protein
MFASADTRRLKPRHAHGGISAFNDPITRGDLRDAPPSPPASRGRQHNVNVALPRTKHARGGTSAEVAVVHPCCKRPAEIRPFVLLIRVRQSREHVMRRSARLRAPGCEHGILRRCDVWPTSRAFAPRAARLAHCHWARMQSRRRCWRGTKNSRGSNGEKMLQWCAPRLKDTLGHTRRHRGERTTGYQYIQFYAPR